MKHSAFKTQISLLIVDEQAGRKQANTDRLEKQVNV